MSDYTPLTDFEVKDSLAHLDPEKIVSGAELQAEFDAIAASVRSKVGSTFNMISAIQTTEVAQVLNDLLFKQGMIQPWYGNTSDIPTGWALCDGTNGTPDLRNRFVVGAGASYNLSTTGGAISASTSSDGAHAHTGATGATEANLPEHNHTLFVATKNGAGGDTQGFGTAANIAVAGDQQALVGYLDVNQSGTQLIGDTGSASSTHSHTISSDGGHTHTVATLPPYYGLYYIMYVGFDTEAGIGNEDTPLAVGVLDDLGDVTISSPTTGQVLTYDGSGWVNDDSSGGAFGASIPLNSQTGTTYTLVLADAGYCIEMSNASANTLTVPPNSSAAFPVGTSILVRQMGAGVTSIAAGVGVTIRKPRGLDIFFQYGSISLHKRATDEWCLEGSA